MNEFMPQDDDEQMRQAFAMMDKDSSGKVSASELKQVMRSIGERLTDDDIDEIMRELDMDGDGEVDYEGSLNECIDYTQLSLAYDTSTCARSHAYSTAWKPYRKITKSTKVTKPLSREDPSPVHEGSPGGKM